VSVREGTKVWFVPNAGGTKHPGIVIRVSADGSCVLLLGGTGTGPRDIPHVVVQPFTRIGKALGLDKPTYFYETAVHVRALAEVEPAFPARLCPLPVFNELRKLARRGAEGVLSDEQVRAWWPPEPTGSG
jgi:hypothetical protein